MTHPERYNHSSQMEYLDDLDAIELQIDRKNRLSLPNQSRFHESDSTQRLLPQRDGTPNDSKSSSGCKLLIVLSFNDDWIPDTEIFIIFCSLYCT